MLTHFLYASSYYHLLFWVHPRYPWLTWLFRLILIAFSYSSHLMTLLLCDAVFTSLQAFGTDVTHFSMPETSNNNFTSLMELESC